MLFASLILGILSVINPCFFMCPKLTDDSPSLILLQSVGPGTCLIVN
jgi:hypothetical protein